MNGNRSLAVFEVEMQCSDGKGHAKKDSAKSIKEVGIYLTGHRDAVEGLEVKSELFAFMTEARSLATLQSEFEKDRG